MSTNNRIFFDIECAANPENIALMPEPKAPANLKDPEKIKAAVEEKKRELIEQAALDPDYGKILSIGTSYGEESDIVVAMVGRQWSAPGEPRADDPINTWTEKDLIEWFWEEFESVRGQCVGYNILGFDLPYLLRRSMYLGVKVPYLPILARYRNDPVTDLMMILCNWDTYKAKGLKQMARLLGIPNDCPDIDGSKVKDLTPDQLREYQASDVRLVMELYKRMNGVYFNF